MSYYNHGSLQCPKCGSHNVTETTLTESCDDCGFGQHYHYWNHDEPSFQSVNEDEDED